MPDLNEHDLSKLFQAAGHRVPDSDLTARIMARVAVTPIHRPATPKPLIGRTGWMLIAALLALPLLGALVPGPAHSEPANGLLSPFWDLLAQLQLASGQWPAWVIGASLVALVLVAMDRWLSRINTPGTHS
jgi:hypothetical protein